MTAPPYNLRTWLQIILKVVLLFIVFDLVFIVLRPFDHIEKLSLFGTLAPYRKRLAYFERNMADQLMPIETLLNAHEIARTKAKDEYRIVILGDSGINGFGNEDNETISAYMTESRTSIQGKQIVAYNLAYPYPSISRDLLIGEAALKYHPDLIIWFISPTDFLDPVDRLVANNQAHMTRLTKQFSLDNKNAAEYGHYSEEWWQNSIIFKRSAILRWFKFQSYVLRDGIQVELTAKDYAIDLPDSGKNYYDLNNISTVSTWHILTALPQLTKSSILIINEPIYIAPQTLKHSDTLYNSYYDRASYDRYRQHFDTYCQNNGLWCLDLWDIVPANEFTNSPLHHTANGNRIIADKIVENLRNTLD